MSWRRCGKIFDRGRGSINKKADYYKLLAALLARLLPCDTPRDRQTDALDDEIELMLRASEKE